MTEPGTEFAGDVAKRDLDAPAPGSVDRPGRLSALAGPGSPP